MFQRPITTSQTFQNQATIDKNINLMGKKNIISKSSKPKLISDT